MDEVYGLHLCIFHTLINIPYLQTYCELYFLTNLRSTTITYLYCFYLTNSLIDKILMQQVYCKNYQYNISKILLCFIFSISLNQRFQIKGVIFIRPMNVPIGQHFLHPLHCPCKVHLFKRYQLNHQLVLHHPKDLLILTLLLPFLNPLRRHKNQNHLRLLSLEAFQTINRFIHH